VSFFLGVTRGVRRGRTVMLICLWRWKLKAPRRSDPPPMSAIFGLRPWSLDVVVYTPEEVERLRGIHGTLLSVIEAEGRLLYERP